MGSAEDAAFAAKRRDEAQREAEQAQFRQETRRIADQILDIMPRVLEAIRDHGGRLDYKIQTIDGRERATWWVTTYQYKQSRNPMEHFYVLDDGAIAVYGSTKDLSQGAVINMSVDMLTTILQGLERIANTGKPVQTQPTLPVTTPKRPGFWKRLLG
jgi:hypothetical protein